MTYADDLRELEDARAALHVELVRVRKECAEQAAALREAQTVLRLFRLHRTGPDWDEPFPADLLDREDAALKRVEEGK